MIAGLGIGSSDGHAAEDEFHATEVYLSSDPASTNGLRPKQQLQVRIVCCRRRPLSSHSVVLIPDIQNDLLYKASVFHTPADV